LVGAWNLDKSEAVEAVQWLITKVVAAVENSEAPTAALRPSNTACTPMTNGQSTNCSTLQAVSVGVQGGNSSAE
jgi:hypothetical protein